MTHQAMIFGAFKLALKGLGWQDVQVKFPLLSDKVCWDLVKAAEQRRIGSSDRRESGAVIDPSSIGHARVTADRLAQHTERGA